MPNPRFKFYFILKFDIKYIKNKKNKNKTTTVPRKMVNNVQLILSNRSTVSLENELFLRRFFFF